MLPNNPNIEELLKQGIEQGLSTTFNKLTRTQVEIVVKSESSTSQIICKSIVTRIVCSNVGDNKTLQLVCQGARNE